MMNVGSGMMTMGMLSGSSGSVGSAGSSSSSSGSSSSSSSSGSGGAGPALTVGLAGPGPSGALLVKEGSFMSLPIVNPNAVHPQLQRMPTTSRLLQVRPIDEKDHLDAELEVQFKRLTEQLAGKSEKDTAVFLFDKVSASPHAHAEITSALLYGFLTCLPLDQIPPAPSVLAPLAPGPASADTALTHLRFLRSIVRDGFQFLVSQLETLTGALFHRLLDPVRNQLVSLIEHLVGARVQGAETLVAILLRQIPGGDVSTKNTHVATVVLESILIPQKNWLYLHPVLVGQALFTYLRLLSDHAKVSPHMQRLQHRETEFCISLLRERFVDCMAIGRDVVRLLVEVGNIKELAAVWVDLLHRPNSFGAHFRGLEQLLLADTRARFLVGRLPVDFEAKLRFMLTSVRMGEQKRYLAWFGEKYLSAPESESLIPDFIRYICCVYHPSNEVLASDIMPRWALIWWLLKCVKSTTVAASARLALFYDWMFFDPAKSNIMNVEPGILLLHNSVLRNQGPMACSLLEFLCLIHTEFFLPMAASVRKSIVGTFQIAVKKRVVPSLVPMLASPLIDPQLRERFATCFPEFASDCQGKGASAKPGAAKSLSKSGSESGKDGPGRLSSVASLLEATRHDSSLATGKEKTDPALGAAPPGDGTDGGARATEPMDVDDDKPVPMEPGQGRDASLESATESSGGDAQPLMTVSESQPGRDISHAQAGDEDAPQQTALSHRREIGPLIDRAAEALANMCLQETDLDPTPLETLVAVLQDVDQVSDALSLLATETMASSLQDAVSALEASSDAPPADLSANPFGYYGLLLLRIMSRIEGKGKQASSDTVERLLAGLISHFRTPLPRFAGLCLLFAHASATSHPARKLRLFNAYTRSLTGQGGAPSRDAAFETVAQDLKLAQQDSFPVLLYLATEVLYPSFAPLAAGNAQLLYLLVSYMDGQILHRLCCLLAQRRLAMFGDDRQLLECVLEVSLEWETLEQVCVWHLLYAEHGSGSATSPVFRKRLENLEPVFVSVLGTIGESDSADYPEALVGLRPFINNMQPTEQLVTALMLLQTDAARAFASSVSFGWARDFPNELASSLARVLKKWQTSTQESAVSATLHALHVLDELATASGDGDGVLRNGALAAWLRSTADLQEFVHLREALQSEGGLVESAKQSKKRRVEEDE